MLAREDAGRGERERDRQPVRDRPDRLPAGPTRECDSSAVPPT
ncbi:hypothetical protein NJ7G_3183 [Natrinema sp. J7-2]|nr:hypothetical protein NJ7G_3183 [Natrinema sp. J7-2]